MKRVKTVTYGKNGLSVVPRKAAYGKVILEIKNTKHKEVVYAVVESVLNKSQLRYGPTK